MVGLVYFCGWEAAHVNQIRVEKKTVKNTDIQQAAKRLLLKNIQHRVSQSKCGIRTSGRSERRKYTRFLFALFFHALLVLIHQVLLLDRYSRCILFGHNADRSAQTAAHLAILGRMIRVTMKTLLSNFVARVNVGKISLEGRISRWSLRGASRQSSGHRVTRLPTGHRDFFQKNMPVCKIPQL